MPLRFRIPSGESNQRVTLVVETINLEPSGTRAHRSDSSRYSLIISELVVCRIRDSKLVELQRASSSEEGGAVHGFRVVDCP